MQITSHHRLEVLFFSRTPNSGTVRYIQKFKTNRYVLKTFFCNLDHILSSHACCDCVFYIGDFNNEYTALFYLPIFPAQATPKISELLFWDIVYTINLDAIPATFDIKFIKVLLKLDEQYQQLAKQQPAK